MIADVSDLKFQEEWMPCHVLDSHNFLIPYVVWADTEAGEVACLCLQADGTFEMSVDDRGQWTPKKEWKKYPAPLRLSRTPKAASDA
jgi:hypothetical protein